MIDRAVKITFFTFFLFFSLYLSIPNIIVLPNINNQSCYMNSVLQVLLRNKDLNDILLENQNSFKCSPIKFYIDFYKELRVKNKHTIYIKNDKILFGLIRLFFYKHRLYFNKKYKTKLYDDIGGHPAVFYDDFINEIRDNLNSHELKKKLTKLFFINSREKIVLFYINDFNDRDEILNLPKYFSIDSNIRYEGMFNLNDFYPGICFEADVCDKYIGLKYSLCCIIVMYEDKEHSVAYLKESGLWYKCDDANKHIYRLANTEIENLISQINDNSRNNSLSSVLFYESLDS